MGGFHLATRHEGLARALFYLILQGNSTIVVVQKG
jgi:hypothetical protein